jgi:hypothetical protein
MSAAVLQPRVRSGQFRLSFGPFRGLPDQVGYEPVDALLAEHSAAAAKFDELQALRREQDEALKQALADDRAETEAHIRAELKQEGSAKPVKPKGPAAQVALEQTHDRLRVLDSEIFPDIEKRLSRALRQHADELRRHAEAQVAAAAGAELAALDALLKADADRTKGAGRALLGHPEQKGRVPFHRHGDVRPPNVTPHDRDEAAGGRGPMKSVAHAARRGRSAMRPRTSFESPS